MSPNSPGSDADLPAPQPLSQGYWARIVAQMDRLQASIDSLLTVSQANGDQVAILLHTLTDPARAQSVDERLADLIARHEASQQEWESLSRSLDDLAQVVAKLNRAQFKSNTLAEMKDQRVATALDALQGIATHREEAQEARTLQDQERLADLRAEARGELAADLLPVLDGLELALDSGQALLERRRQQEFEAAQRSHASAPTSPSFSRRLAWVLSGRGLPPTHAGPSAPMRPDIVPDEFASALEAWLQGLEMVHRRFLGLLATSDIHPIQAKDQPFDPHEHLAMATETRPGVPDGTVVTVLRKGYRQRGRVLRYAEVVVNRALETQSDANARAQLSDSLTVQVSEGLSEAESSPEE
jgi:molecular chaperone GrpE (heat shock protein)